MFGRLIVISVLCVLLPASATDAFLHLHDDPEHNHHAAERVSPGILHTHVENGAPADESHALRADSGEGESKARFANLFRFVPAAQVMPVFDLGPVQLLPDPGCSSSGLVELVPSAHDPPPLVCSIPRSPPA